MARREEDFRDKCLAEAEDMAVEKYGRELEALPEDLQSAVYQEAEETVSCRLVDQAESFAERQADWKRDV